jgi:hypothetical protein
LKISNSHFLYLERKICVDIQSWKKPTVDNRSSAPYAHFLVMFFFCANTSLVREKNKKKICALVKFYLVYADDSCNATNILQMSLRNTEGPIHHNVIENRNAQRKSLDNAAADVLHSSD